MDSGSPRSPLDDGEIGDDESKEFDDGYDENLMGDEEDRRKLAQMTEKEREQELFDRSERRETLRIRFEIERKLRTKAKKREQQEKKQSKQARSRKRLRASEIYSSDGSSEDSDEYTPDTDRASAFDDVNNGGKSTRMNTRASAQLMSSSSTSSASSASSSQSSDSGPEDDDLGADDDSQTIRDDFQMTLAELRQLQLKRSLIEQWVYAPFFKDTAIGLFVKISVATIGAHTRQPMHTMYRIGQIIDIKTSPKIYALDPPGEFKTDKQCQVRIGGVDRTYAMSFVSNRDFDEDDYNKWRSQLDSDRYGMPSRDHYIKKRTDLHRAHNFQYKEEDIMFEVNEKKRFKDSPYNFALKKTELMGEKAEAEASNDFDRVREIQQQIDDLEEKAKQLEKSRSSSTFSAISFVNEKNRKKNIEESERVLKESKTVKTEDPFTRRKCNPTIVHNKNNNGDTIDPRPIDKNGQDVSTIKTSGSNSKTISLNNGSQISVAESVKSVDDLFQAHASIDLELDIDI